MTCLMPKRAAASTFSLMPPTRKHAPAQADFPGHRHVRAHPPPRQQRRQRRDERHARARAVLGRRAGRHVNVNVVLAVIGQVDAQRLGLAAQIAHRRLRALLHHFAQRTGQQQVALARHPRRFDEQDFAAHRRPGQAGGDADIP